MMMPVMMMDIREQRLLLVENFLGKFVVLRGCALFSSTLPIEGRTYTRRNTRARISMRMCWHW